MKILEIYVLCAVFAAAPTLVSAGEELTASACGPALSQIADVLQSRFGGANASILIEQDSRTLLTRSFGRGIGTDTEFFLGSVNKSLDAVIALRLLEQKRITLERRIEGDLPEDFRKDLSAEWSKIELRNLLNHTSGIEDYMNHADSDAQAHADIVLASPQSFSTLLGLAGKDLWFSPLTNLAYSNTNYLVLTKVLEGVTGDSFPILLRRELTEILGLRHTGVASSSDEGELVGRTNIAIPNLEGVGSAYSSAQDLMRFLSELDGDALLSRDSINELLFRADPHCQGNSNCKRYGMGFSLRHEAGYFNWVLHEGHLASVSNVVAKIPSDKLNLVILSDEADLQLEGIVLEIFHRLKKGGCVGAVRTLASLPVDLASDAGGGSEIPPAEDYETNIPHLDTTSSYARSAIAANILRYQKTKHAEIQAALSRQSAGRFVSICEQIFPKQSIPTDVCWLAQLESAWKSEALSAAGAYGYWQFEEFVALQYGLGYSHGIDLRTQFEPSTEAASELLRDNHVILGDWALAIGAYDSGVGAMQDAIKQSGSENFWYLAQHGFLSRETANYVPAFIANVQIGRHPERYGF